MPPKGGKKKRHVIKAILMSRLEVWQSGDLCFSGKTPDWMLVVRCLKNMEITPPPRVSAIENVP